MISLLAETAQTAAPAGDGMLALFAAGVVLTLVVGFYGVMVTDNLVRTLIGMEILTKGVTLLIIVAGYFTNQVALAQSLAIILIVVEVAVMVVAVGVVYGLFRHNKSIDSKTIRNFKG
ncbi:MAG: NADH-quinone oxidoreductase subunit K [Phycisphaerae bacterium]